jgi:hypothetical protein
MLILRVRSLCSQTKIWKEEQKMKCGFSIDFSTVHSPKSSTHALENFFENPHFIFCSSFQNLRLGGVKLTRSCVGQSHRHAIIKGDIQLRNVQLLTPEQCEYQGFKI